MVYKSICFILNFYVTFDPTLLLSLLHFIVVINYARNDISLLM
jgi:hypothetical protein